MQENDLNKKKPIYIKAKERTSHMIKKIEVEKKSLKTAKKSHEAHLKVVGYPSHEVHLKVVSNPSHEAHLAMVGNPSREAQFKVVGR